jgi:hypothetical protein
MMVLRLLDILNITLAALVVGVFWGPWLALTRSMSRFAPDEFVAIVHRLDTNLGGIMTLLFPVTMLSFVPILVLTFASTASFFLALAAFLLFLVALIVTGAVEVPIVKRIRGWTPSTVPTNWQALRDRWASFHLLRVIPGIVGLPLLVGGALWQR